VRTPSGSPFSIGPSLEARSTSRSTTSSQQFVPYAKQQEFFELGSTRRERMFNAGNQLGKSDAGAYETACHVTGIYPSWWTGLRFDKPILAWACGLTADKTMGINQLKLCGKPNTPDTLGTGLIPKSCFTTDPVLGRGTTGHMQASR
jgi:hypothetical protein